MCSVQLSTERRWTSDQYFDDSPKASFRSQGASNNCTNKSNMLDPACMLSAWPVLLARTRLKDNQLQMPLPPWHKKEANIETSSISHTRPQYQIAIRGKSSKALRPEAQPHQAHRFEKLTNQKSDRSAVIEACRLAAERQTRTRLEGPQPHRGQGELRP